MCLKCRCLLLPKCAGKRLYKVATGRRACAWGRSCSKRLVGRVTELDSFFLYSCQHICIIEGMFNVACCIKFSTFSPRCFPHCSLFFVKLHPHRRLLAARFGILPLFFLNCSCFFLSLFEEKGKMPILAAKSRPCECSFSYTPFMK